MAAAAKLKLLESLSPEDALRFKAFNSVRISPDIIGTAINASLPPGTEEEARARVSIAMSAAAKAFTIELAEAGAMSRSCLPPALFFLRSMRHVNHCACLPACRPARPLQRARLRTSRATAAPSSRDTSWRRTGAWRWQVACRGWRLPRPQTRSQQQQQVVAAMLAAVSRP